MELRHNDIASERLVLELRRADVVAELQLPQIASHHDLLSDQILALDMQLEELHRLDNIYAGQRMQQSMYTAMLTDSRAIVEQRRLEQQAITDRVAAAVVNGDPAPPTPPETRQQLDSGTYDDERLTQLEEAALTEDDGFIEDGFTVVGTQSVVMEDRVSMEMRIQLQRPRKLQLLSTSSTT